MKVKGFQWLPWLTAVFVLFVAILFVSRNANRTPVQTYTLKTEASYPLETATTEHQNTATTETSTELETIPEKININTATLEQLDSLPGIGPTLAQRILDYRTTYGAFGSAGELLNVDGIGAQKLEDIWDLITVEGA